jgi:large subunit ribosomal protein L29
MVECRELTVEELAVKLEELRKEHMNLRFQKSTQQLEKPHQLRIVRRDIARVLMAIDEKRVEKDGKTSAA